MSKPVENSDYAADEILTEEIARAFIQDPDSQDLSGYLVMEDAAAEILSGHNGGLFLDGLISLSDYAAVALSKHNGNLSLPSLKSLSDSAAIALGKHHGTLNICGLTALLDSPGHLALAENLSRTPWGIDLECLRSLSYQAARILSRHQGQLLLPSLESLSDSVAESLASKKYQRDGLDEYLELNLENLSSVSESTALELWKIPEGGLYLAGASGNLKIFMLIGRILIQTSDPDIIDPDEFDLSGLDSIDLEQARRIARQPWYANLSGLETLDVETAEVLADHKGTLCLTGLRELSTQVAEALAKHEGPVLLDRDQLPSENLAIVKPTCQ